MKSVKTFTGVCGPFGAPPARTCFGRWRAPYLRGAGRPRWGARHGAAIFLRSASPAPVRHLTNEIGQNIHRRLWPLWSTPSTPLFWPVLPFVAFWGLLAVFSWTVGSCHCTRLVCSWVQGPAPSGRARPVVVVLVLATPTWVRSAVLFLARVRGHRGAVPCLRCGLSLALPSAARCRPVSGKHIRACPTVMVLLASVRSILADG